MIIVGLTGNYGMGKSTVARLFSELGAEVIDADAVVTELFTEQAVIDELRAAFGDEIAPGGVVDRARLAGIVFRSAPQRIALENLLHPKVFERVKQKIVGLSRRADVVVVEAPVLFERSYQSKFDKIVTVFADEEVTLERLKNKGVPEDEALRRLNSQFPVRMKVERSDFAIDNGGDLESTRRQVLLIYEELKQLSKGRLGGMNSPGAAPYGNN